MRDHKEIPLKKFNGLWDRGDIESVPSDHFSDCENIRFVGTDSFATRYGLDKSQNVVGPLGNIVRVYNFVTQLQNTLLVLTYDGTTGKIYHVVNATTVFGPLLTITGMEDFGFTPYAGRAYITPFKSTVVNGLNVEKGMSGEFLYVYKGDGTACRKAAGNPPTGTLTVGNGAAGHTDGGFKVFGVVFETDTGYLTPPAAFATFTTGNNLSVNFSTIPTSPSSSVIKRHIVSTINIKNFNGDTSGYQFFFIPNATINDNVGTTLSNISFYDADLIDDASHLLDNYSEIPAGVGLGLYHNRLCLYTSNADINMCLVSAEGEPEAFSQLNGFIIVPPDGNPLTNAQEMRDVLYVFKRNRTVSFVDNGDEPSSWKMTTIDLAIGAPVHGVATVIDSGSTSVDFLIVASYLGILLFNGNYSLPELSWKVGGLWTRQTRNDFRFIQLVNDPIGKCIYCALPDRRLLIGDYNNGMDPMKIRWAPWRFETQVNTIALVNINDLIIGAQYRRAS